VSGLLRTPRRGLLLCPRLPFPLSPLQSTRNSHASLFNKSRCTSHLVQRQPVRHKYQQRLLFQEQCKLSHSWWYRPFSCLCPLVELLLLTLQHSHQQHVTRHRMNTLSHTTMDSGETPSSTSDFYAADTPDKAGQNAPAGLPDMNHHQKTIMTMHQDDDQDQAMDSSSEAMDISDASRSASPEPNQKPLPQPLPQSCLTGVKRSLDEDARVTNGGEQSSEYPNQRRRLLSPDASLVTNSNTPAAPQPTLHPRGVAALPTQVWQQVFVKLPAGQLGLCLRVCKTFKRILTDSEAAPAPRRDDAVTQIMSHEQVWRQVRQTFYPQLPRPLAGYTELKMLRLLGACVCHRCRRVPTSPPATISAYERGPGLSSARIIWPLGTALCGTCLRDSTVKVRSPSLRAEYVLMVFVGHYAPLPARGSAHICFAPRLLDPVPPLHTGGST